MLKRNEMGAEQMFYVLRAHDTELLKELVRRNNDVFVPLKDDFELYEVIWKHQLKAGWVYRTQQGQKELLLVGEMSYVSILNYLIDAGCVLRFAAPQSEDSMPFVWGESYIPMHDVEEELKRRQ